MPCLRRTAKVHWSTLWQTIRRGRSTQLYLFPWHTFGIQPKRLCWHSHWSMFHYNGCGLAANLLPRTRFFFGQHQEHGLWPGPICTQSQWRSIFVVLLFQSQSLRSRGGLPALAQSLCSWCWPKDKRSLGRNCSIHVARNNWRAQITRSHTLSLVLII